MTHAHADRLYRLLPAVYRTRDAEQGEPLRALLRIVEDEMRAVHEDVEGLYADWFVETCSDALLPYLGDLVGMRGLGGDGPGGLPSQRALVANAIAWRRRKGTTTMLEELARSVTGWGARAQPSFEVLAWNQHLDHVRHEWSPPPDTDWAYRPADAWAPVDNARKDRMRGANSGSGVGTVDLRHRDQADRVGGAFDDAGHTVDVRRIRQSEGWHNLRSVAIHLWRLQAYPLKRVEAARSGKAANGWHFDPLGAPMPLFHFPETEDDMAGRVRERHVAAPLRPVALGLDLLAHSQVAHDGSDEDARDNSVHYGPLRNLAVYVNGSAKPVPPSQVLARDLSQWGPVPAGFVAIDARLGRLAFGTPLPNGVHVTYCHGFSADVGGGSYDVAPPEERAHILVARDPTVKPKPPAPDQPAPPVLDSLATALTDAVKRTGRVIVEILDSGTYHEPLNVDVPAGTHLVVRAAPRQRPLLRPKPGGADTPWIVKGLATPAGQTAPTFELRGCVVAGAGLRAEGTLASLRLAHCTLVPGLDRTEHAQTRLPVSGATPSLTSKAAGPLRIELERCITGPLHLPSRLHELFVRECILDAPEVLSAPVTPAMRQADEALPTVKLDAPRVSIGPPKDAVAPHATSTDHLFGPAATIERSTVLGAVTVQELCMGSESIFLRPVRVQRRQSGCVRFSWLPESSETPRRHRCQPHLALEKKMPAKEADAIRMRLRPAFSSLQYGDPAYAQLGLLCAPEVREGAEDGSEMGVFCHLKQPQREKSLRVRLDEFLPFGLEAGLIYMS